jgi:hypothetical protein
MSTDHAPVRPLDDRHPTAEEHPRALRARRVALRLIYGVLAVWTLLMAQGVVLLAAGQSLAGWHFMFATSTVFTLLSLAAVVPLTWTAGRSVGAARWLALGVLSWLIAEALTGQLRPLESVSMVVVWLGPWLALAPERRRLLTRAPRPGSPMPVAVSAVAVVLCAVWAVRNAALTPTTFPPAFGVQDAVNDLRLDMAGLAVVLGLAAIAVGLSWPRAAAPTVVTGLAAAATGLAALVRPNDLGSPGLIGGIVLIAGSLVMLGWVSYDNAGRRRRQHVPTSI